MTSTPPSPATTMAYALLRQHLYRHIDEAEFLATMAAGWSADDVETARELIPDLTDAIRHVVSLHAVDDAGICSACCECWPCASFTVVHEVVTDPERRIAGMLTEHQR